MQKSGIDVEGIRIGMERYETEEQQRYLTIDGLRSDQAETVRAIILDYDEDEERESWHGEDEDHEP